jgi:hypothetical protein
MKRITNLISLSSDDTDDDKLYKNAVRRVFSRSKQNKRIRNNAVSTTKQGPKGGKYLVCSECGESFPPNQCEVDHNDPCVPVDIAAKDQAFIDFYERVRCDDENLCVLCKECHSIKSKFENAERRRIKKEKKEKAKQ